MRFIAYDYVKAYGKEALTREYLEKIGELGNEVLGKTKEPSTIRAKAKAIYNWIMENYKVGNGINNWNYKRKLTNEEYEMTRKERALKNAKELYEKAHKKIISLATGMFKNEYLKKDGSYNINKLAKDTGYSRPTIYKHLKDEGLINIKQEKNT
jgi:DNA-binding phage protein